ISAIARRQRLRLRDPERAVPGRGREAERRASLPARAAMNGAGTVHIRPIRSTDAAGLKLFYSGLSAESRRTRFFSITSGLSQAQSVSFCTTDHEHQEGFVAVAGGPLGGPDRIVGHLCLEPDGAASEVA